MTNRDVLVAFVNGREAKANNLTTDGKVLINYSTVIAKHEGEKIAVTTKKYSVTTSKIQNQLKKEIPALLLKEYYF